MRDGLWYLRARMELVENRISQVVAFRRSVDPTPDDPFRGLYVGEETVDALLAPHDDPPSTHGDRLLVIEDRADVEEAHGGEFRLRRLARCAGLTDLDVELLLICALPEIDARWERLYGYLNDDVSRRRASPGLALALAGYSTWDAVARARLAPGAPLASLGLLEFSDVDRPFLTRTLRVPDRVVDHLLGDDAPPRALTDILVDPGLHRGETTSRVARALRSSWGLIYLRDDTSGVGSAAVVAAAAEVRRRSLVIDARRLGGRDVGAILHAVRREAVLTDAVVVVESFHELSESDSCATLFECPTPVVLVGHGPWAPETGDRLPILVEVPAVATADRLAMWRNGIGQADSGIQVGDVAVYALNPAQIRRAVANAAAVADVDATTMTVGHVREGARMLNSAGLQRLARRTTPAVDWDDLVLPASTTQMLRDLAARARYRERVLGEWRMRPGGGRGHGVIGLFAGDSGTGKTMAAEVLAADLGLDMYTVDLASVVSKWIGETEKNLDRIFAEAESVNAVLVFDEADALFGKRSEVRDAQDRYANVETAYLLARMESFRGLAILTTNLRANLDDAFTRRLDAVVEFPRPDENARRELWRRCLRDPVPCAPHLDLEFCAGAFPMSGGNIRAAAVSAAYRAADTGHPVGTDDLVYGIEQEYRKLGRLIGPEFARSEQRSTTSAAADTRPA
ncbi:ATP-binding protein [Gordonia rhizosphera]|uniref:ATP-binding protein n=1 Tax=Gordonia rhizosphera TaxID=83341 RepID=UPI0002F38973|nr:ATP-binding protein [Gordonia rhizosphera]